MKEIKIKLYSYDELSEDVRKRIAEEQCFTIMEIVMDGYNSEYESSLECFERQTGFKAVNWEVGYYTHRFLVREPEEHIMGTWLYPVYAEDIKGKLLWRWCRDFIDRNRRGKWYSTCFDRKNRVYHLGKRSKDMRSKVHMEPIEGGWCPWTGCCTDCSLVEPIVDFYLNYHRGKFSESYDLKDLIEDCLEKFFSEWESEYNAYGNNKDGCVEETISANSDGDLYFADGRKYNGPDIDVLEELVA